MNYQILFQSIDQSLIIIIILSSVDVSYIMYHVYNIKYLN